MLLLQVHYYITELKKKIQLYRNMCPSISRLEVAYINAFHMGLCSVIKIFMMHLALSFLNITINLLMDSLSNQ